MAPADRQEALRKIPKIDEILANPGIAELSRGYPRAVVVEAVRRGVERLRKEILGTRDFSTVDDTAFSLERLYPLFREEMDRQTRPRLRRVINATGVVIHTNLGRSPLHSAALDHLIEISGSYSNLEYDLQTGERGSRYVHVEEILCRLSGAESALVLNNNAGAVLLVLGSMAEGKEVVVSRGELVEIGGTFRIPDVMRRSGALLKEVGTTNRTYVSDYEKAVGTQTALLLKVHTSNFRVRGFTAEVSLEDLVRLGKALHLPVVNDLGSGCLVDLGAFGLEKEPTVQEAVKTGADVVTFSGDKLLGGPQAGIIVGKKAALDLIKTNPLTRALRIDKLTLAALESTLLLYFDQERAMKEIPTLRMLTLDKATLDRRGARLVKRLRPALCDKARVALGEDVSEVGGGALPLQELPTVVVSIRPVGISVNVLAERLRNAEPAIVSRISRDEVLLDMRTVSEEEIPLLAAGVEKVLTDTRAADETI
jgi:L-seryl-tRNA(Ser) seleniumtransferase